MKRISTIAILAASLLIGCKSGSAPAKNGRGSEGERGAHGPLLLPPGGSMGGGDSMRPTPAPRPDGPQVERRGGWGGADLTPEQRGARREEMQARRQERMQEMLATYDADRDGRMSETERTAMREGRVAEMVDRLDTDHDGKLSKTELEGMADHGPRAADSFANLDTNADGFISVDEMVRGRPGGFGRRGTGDRGARLAPGGDAAEIAPPSPTAPAPVTN